MVGSIGRQIQMNTPIAVFFHARLSGGCNVDTGLSIDPQFGRKLFLEQWKALVADYPDCLFWTAEQIFIGVNGRHEDAEWIRNIVGPYPKAVVLEHGEKAESLLPTMHFLQNWLPGHEDYAVCFFHTKGVTRPDNKFYQDWRKCMEYCVIYQWRRCVYDLNSGFDSVGAHWLENQATDIPTWGHGHFWGGVFWWAKAKYLLTLKKIPNQITPTAGWWEPEHWIGTGTQPKVRDYAPHWPNPKDCGGIAEQLERERL
jgi:hypothetical protein